MTIGILADDIVGSDTYDSSTLDNPLISDNVIKSNYILGLHHGNTAIIHLENIGRDIKLQLKK